VQTVRMGGGKEFRGSVYAVPVQLRAADGQTRSWTEFNVCATSVPLAGRQRPLDRGEHRPTYRLRQFKMIQSKYRLILNSFRPMPVASYQ